MFISDSQIMVTVIRAWVTSISYQSTRVWDNDWMPFGHGVLMPTGVCDVWHVYLAREVWLECIRYSSLSYASLFWVLYHVYFRSFCNSGRQPWFKSMWDLVLNVCPLGYYALWIISTFGHLMTDPSRRECPNCLFLLGEGHHIDAQDAFNLLHFSHCPNLHKQ